MKKAVEVWKENWSYLPRSPDSGLLLEDSTEFDPQIMRQRYVDGVGDSLA